jgi:ketosteroid isomerase-like protein
MSSATTGGTGVVERFLSTMVAHDWDAFEACISDEFTRVGPFGDTYTTRAGYVAFLSELMPTLAGYRMEVSRVTYAGTVAFAELAETVEVDGTPLRTPECLTFDLAPDGRIARVEVFTQSRAPV